MINGIGKSGSSYPLTMHTRFGLVATKVDEILRETTTSDRRLKLSTITKSNLELSRKRPPRGPTTIYHLTNPE